MKSVFKISLLILLSFVINSCRKDNHVLPVLSTNSISAIGHITATSGGYITNYGETTILSAGVCWSKLEMPTIIDNKTSDGTTSSDFKSLLTGLSATTTYYVRAYATNSIGTGYGGQILFVTGGDYTGQTGTVNDIDGNVYETIGIGSQIWFSENLKTTKLSNGTAIQNVTVDSTWYTLSTPAYCWNDNDEATNKSLYGALYNWLTVNTGILCPTGWHVPDQDEWNILIDDLGGYSLAGGKLKEIGTKHWATPNLDATNETNFTALPGGFRSYLGSFYDIGNMGGWWSSTEVLQNHNGHSAVAINLFNANGIASSYLNESLRCGYSVRCIKDN